MKINTLIRKGNVSSDSYKRLLDEVKEAAEARSKLKHVKDSKLINLKRIPYNVEEFDTVAERALENAVSYGYASWYYWRVANWGVKWDVFDVSIRRTNDTEITVNFKTPWNTPTCAIVELSRKFPHANICVKYADEDIGSNCGWYALCKGDFVDDGYPSKGNAAIDFGLFNFFRVFERSISTKIHKGGELL